MAVYKINKKPHINGKFSARLKNEFFQALFVIVPLCIVSLDINRGQMYPFKKFHK